MNLIFIFLTLCISNNLLAMDFEGDFLSSQTSQKSEEKQKEKQAILALPKESVFSLLGQKKSPINSNYITGEHPICSCVCYFAHKDDKESSCSFKIGTGIYINESEACFITNVHNAKISLLSSDSEDEKRRKEDLLAQFKSEAFKAQVFNSLGNDQIFEHYLLHPLYEFYSAHPEAGQSLHAGYDVCMVFKNREGTYLNRAQNYKVFFREMPSPKIENVNLKGYVSNVEVIADMPIWEFLKFNFSFQKNVTDTQNGTIAGVTSNLKRELKEESKGTIELKEHNQIYGTFETLPSMSGSPIYTLIHEEEEKEQETSEKDDISEIHKKKKTPVYEVYGLHNSKRLNPSCESFYKNISSVVDVDIFDAFLKKKKIWERLSFEGLKNQENIYPSSPLLFHIQSDDSSERVYIEAFLRRIQHGLKDIFLTDKINFFSFSGKEGREVFTNVFGGDMLTALNSINFPLQEGEQKESHGPLFPAPLSQDYTFEAIGHFLTNTDTQALRVINLGVSENTQEVVEKIKQLKSDGDVISYHSLNYFLKGDELDAEVSNIITLLAP